MGLEDRIKYRLNLIREYLFRKDTKKLREDTKEVLKKYQDTIPVFIISYNNAIYVKNMVNQLKNFDIKPIIIDNNSDDKDSIKILKELSDKNEASVIFSDKNFGCFVGFLNPIYEVLPNYFAYTDPDLELNKNLPKDFLEILKGVTDEFKVYKAGFALELLDEEMIDLTMTKYQGVPKIKEIKLTVRDWESKYWRFRLEHPTLEIYQANLDTTFALYNKKNLLDNFYDGVRVAGDFSCIHLPWYPKRDIMTKKQKESYLKSNKSSTWVK
jgi:hypothetical protein